MTAQFWTLDKNAHKSRIKLFGETLRGLAVGMRSLQNIDGDFLYALEPHRDALSIPVAKILAPGQGNRSLIGCIRDAALPSLKPSTELTGDVFEIVPATLITLVPPDGPGFNTGLEIDARCVAFALHGFGYDAESKTWIRHVPWDGDSRVAIADWLKQQVVQVNPSQHRTIDQVIREVRDKRGAHSDDDWTKQLPQLLRQFYQFYAGLFVVEVAHLLLSEALTAMEHDSRFAERVFPRHEDPKSELAVPFPSYRDRVSIPPPDEDFLEWNNAECPPLGITRQTISGPGSMMKGTAIWFIRAPGDFSDSDRGDLGRMLANPGQPLERLEGVQSTGATAEGEATRSDH